MFRWTVALSIVVGLAALLLLRKASSPSIVEGKSVGQPDLLRHLGGISPWIPKTTGARNGTALPPGCVIDQIHMMSRHSERFPTFSTGVRMLELYQRIRKENVTFSGDLAFIHDWDFFAPHPAEQFEQLTTTGPYAGTLTAFTEGVELRTRYLALLEIARNQARKISLWASLSNRVINTSRYFAAGFFGIDWSDLATLHIIPETIDRGADTLTPGRACPNYATDSRGHIHGIQQMEAFRSTYLPPIAQRLQKYSSPPFALSDAEVFTMQELCAFELLAKGASPWCDVFTRDEMLSFEYARDVLYYYRSGPGNHFGSSLGWLWLNATTALLQQGPDAGPMFLSFNHDGDIVAMLAALDLFPQASHLPTTHVDHQRDWRMSDVVPMAGRIIFERFVCPAPQECWDNAPLYPNHVYCKPGKNDTYVRININNAIVPLPACTDGLDNSCRLDSFTQRIRKRGGEIPRFADICGIADDVPHELTFLHQ